MIIKQSFIFLPKHFIFLFLLLFISLSVSAQKIKITGKIIDDQTEEPIPFANVVLIGKTMGVSTDFDGQFTFETERLADSIRATSIGYKKVSKYIQPNNYEQTINFRLLREDYMMEEVVIYAGENPANKIVKKIIKNKPKNNLNNRDFSYESYNKLELDLTNFDKNEMTKNKLLKPFAFIFENIDSISEERPFLPFFLTETLSDFYHTATPKNKKEIIKATNALGAKNESLVQFLGTMYQQIDVYDNYINIMGKNFVSPIADLGLFYYEYYLVDSATVDNKWCYKLTFKPKRKQELTFIGDFWVADTAFAIRKMSMEIAKDVNINFIKRLSVFQEYEPYSDTIWAIKKDKLIVDFVATKNSPSFIGRRTNNANKYSFNSKTIDKIFNEQKDDLILQDNVMNESEEFWSKARPDSLSKSEKKIYAMVDTIKKMPIVKTYVEVITTIVSGYKTLGKVSIGPYFNLVSIDAVEGYRLRLGLKTNKKFSERFQVGGYLAYGFKDKTFKYGADGKYIISRKPWQNISTFYSNDLDIQSRSSEEFGEDNLFAGLYRIKNVPQKLTKIEQFNATYSREWRHGLSNSVTIAQKKIDPYFKFYYFNKSDATTLPDSVINTSEIKINTRFAYREKFIVGKFDRTSMGTQYPIINVNYTIGLKNILNSQFEYHKIEASLSHYFYLASAGYTDYIISAGKIFGQVPFLLLENHPGNETYFFNTYSFNRMNEYEFISDTYAQIFITHHFGGIFFNRLPLIRKLKFREVFTAKAVAGSISKKNIAFNTDPSNQKQNFEGLVNNWKLQAPSWEKPYVELGVGVENILKLFRVDCIWRLNYNATPQKPGVRIGMQLHF